MATPARASQSRTRFRAWRIRAERLGVFVAFFVFWELAARVLFGPQWISSPLRVAERIRLLYREDFLWIHIIATVQEAVLGLVIGFLAGAVVGIALGSNARIWSITSSLVMAIYSLPRVALAPLFIIWLGIGLASKVALGATIVFFMVLFNVRQGAASIDQELVDMMRTMRAPRSLILRHVVIPSLVPWLTSAVRIGIGMALIGAVVAELMGASRGLGWYITRSSNMLDMTGAMTGLFLLGVLAVLFNSVLALVEARLLRWKRTEGPGRWEAM